MVGKKEIIKELQTKNLVNCQSLNLAEKMTEEEWAEIKEAIVANLEKNVEEWTIKEIQPYQDYPNQKMKVIVHTSAQMGFTSKRVMKVDFPRMFAQELFTKEQWKKINQIVPNFVQQTPPSNWDWGTVALYGGGGLALIVLIIFVYKWIKSKS